MARNKGTIQLCAVSAFGLTGPEPVSREAVMLAQLFAESLQSLFCALGGVFEILCQCVLIEADRKGRPQGRLGLASALVVG